MNTYIYVKFQSFWIVGYAQIIDTSKDLIRVKIHYLYSNEDHVEYHEGLFTREYFKTEEELDKHEVIRMIFNSKRIYEK